MEDNKILKFVAFTSTVNPGFWKTLTEVKLDVDKLSEERKPIWGKYTTDGPPNSTNIYFEVDSTSFNKYVINFVLITLNNKTCVSENVITKTLIYPFVVT